VHIIRDGRDIALSLKKMGGFAPLPWDRSETNSLVATALYWEWMVRHGRAAGRRFPADYIEIRYEDLITNPRETLGKLGSFIDHDLDYDQIQRAALGRLSETNSSFREEESKAEIHPLGRWKERLSAESVAAIEGTVGDLPRRKRLPALASGSRTGRQFALLVDAVDVSRVPRQQALAQDEHAGGSLRRCFRAGTRGRPAAIAESPGS
jgi:hypothetical protein